MWGMPFDPRPIAIEAERYPDRLLPQLTALMEKYGEQAQKRQSGK
jgi:hypothetical protein